LNDIHESPKHFPKTKLENEEFFNSVSIPISKLNDFYQTYCTRHGLKTKNIREEVKIIEEYKLEVHEKIDKSTVAYTNIRWKKSSEKKNNIKRDMNEEAEEASCIKMFLQDECIKSKFH
jgi:hypothetical protein